MRVKRIKPKKPKELDFLIRYPESGRWVTARVCDYHTVLSGYDTLKKAKYHVIRRPIITIKFDYPLTKSVKFTFCRPTGFTYLDLLACVYKGYCKIYKEVRKYGVWGHSISDLFLEGLIIKGPGQYELAIGS